MTYSLHISITIPSCLLSSVIPVADQDQDQDPDCFHNILSDPDIFILLYCIAVLGSILSDPDIFILLYSCIGEYFVRSGYFYPAV